MKYEKGKRFKSKKGEWCTVVEYIHSKRVGVVFDGYTEVYWTRNENLACGDLYNKESVDDNVRGSLFIGQRFYSKNFGVCILTKFLRDYKAEVEFPDGTVTITDRTNLLKKFFKNPNQPHVYGLGCIGQGKYDSSYKAYDLWTGMLERCYANSNLAYRNVRVSKEWLNFQNFASDYYEMFNECKFERPQLDKDLLTPLTKEGRGVLYSKDTCCLLPHQINTALQLSLHVNKKSDLPCGVSICHTGKYKVQMQKFNKHISVGRFSDLKLATQAYNREKSKYISELALQFKDELPVKIYEALLIKSKEILNAQHN